MAGNSRDAHLNIVGRDKTGPAIRSAARNFDKLDRDAKTRVAGFIGKFTANLGEGVTRAMTSVGGPAGAALIGAILAAVTVSAPLIGASLAAGVLLGVGGGVIAAGIMAAAKDPRVAAAFTSMKTRAEAVFKGFGLPFIQPLIRAAGTFAGAIEIAAPALKRMSAAAAPMVDKLAPALSQMALNSLPGMERAMKASLPLLRTLAEYAPKLGQAMSQFFDLIAQSGPDANKALGFLLRTAIAGILFLGLTIRGLSWSFGQLDAAIQRGKNGVALLSAAIGGLRARVSGFFAGASGWLRGAGAAIVQGLVDGITGAAGRVAGAIGGLVARARAAIPSGLGGLIAGFGGGAEFAFAGGGGGRTGGPVQVSSEVHVSLDGRPFRSMTAHAITSSQSRSDWRARVGKR